jgi:hypothetical protein
LGDSWDKGWLLSESNLYFRTNLIDEFTQVNFETALEQITEVKFSVPDSTEFFQYYFEAKDNRGWTTKIPFGDKKYFELDDRPLIVTDHNIINFKIYPNPVKAGDNITLNNDIISSEIQVISIFDVLGKNIPVIQNINDEKNQISTVNLNPGFYIIILKTKDRSIVNKFIVY